MLPLEAVVLDCLLFIELHGTESSFTGKTSGLRRHLYIYMPIDATCPGLNVGVSLKSSLEFLRIETTYYIGGDIIPLFQCFLFLSLLFHQCP